MNDHGKTAIITWTGVGVYLTSVLLFLIEFLGEITGLQIFAVSWLFHELITLATLFGFVVGAALIWRSHVLLTRRNQDIELSLQAARGEFFKMLKLQFDKWALSEAERDIAMLTVKGLSVAEIAALRQTSQGTVKSQNNSIYKKAGVKTRTQLLGALIDDLLVEGSSQETGVSSD